MRYLLMVMVLAGCGGEPSGEQARATHPTGGTDQGSEAPPPDPEPEPPSRDLGSEATFADLVDAARALDGRSAGDSDAGCLLRSDGSWRLEADLAVPLRPLPDPVDSLAQALRRHRGPMRVLSRWGQRGSGRRALAAFTMTPRTDGEALLLFVASDGLRLRATGGDAGSDAPFPPADLGSRLAAAEATGPIVVTADAGTPLERLGSVLAALPSDATVALGVLLPEDTRLPERLVPADAGDAGLCPEGLPPTGDAEGRFDPAAASEALTDLRARVSRCNDYRSAAGNAAGALTVSLRLGSGGAVTAVCATSDTVEDPVLRACTLEAIREVTFPDPGGVVDLALPLRFEPSEHARQIPLCR